jgi:hypothetical protein
VTKQQQVDYAAKRKAEGATFAEIGKEMGVSARIARCRYGVFEQKKKRDFFAQDNLLDYPQKVQKSMARLSLKEKSKKRLQSPIKICYRPVAGNQMMYTVQDSAERILAAFETMDDATAYARPYFLIL